MPDKSENGAEAGARLLYWCRRNGVILEFWAYGIDRENRTVAAVRVKARGAIGNKGGQIGGRRGKIGGYTPASRARFREAIFMVEPAIRPQHRGNRRHYPASFLTLTYPASWDPDPHKWKRHLDLWFQRLKRRYPGAWAIWALEFQQRKAPHFHLIVYWGSSRPREKWKERRTWILSSWAATVGHDESQPSHPGAGTRVTAIGNVTKVRHYITKQQTKDVVPVGAGAHARSLSSVVKTCHYILKRQSKGEVPAGFGRWWGIHNRRAYKAVAVQVEVQMPQELTAAVATAIQNDWREYLQLGEDVENYTLPRWVSGPAANRVLLGAGVWEVVFAADWVDPRSGEVVTEQANDDTSSRPKVPLPAQTSQLKPPVASQPSPPAPEPPESPGLVYCEQCGRPQTRLEHGLCWVCQGL